MTYIQWDKLRSPRAKGQAGYDVAWEWVSSTVNCNFCPPSLLYIYYHGLNVKYRYGHNWIFHCLKNTFLNLNTNSHWDLRKCFLTMGSVQSCSIFHYLHLHLSIFTIKRALNAIPHTFQNRWFLYVLPLKHVSLTNILLSINILETSGS